MKPIGFFTQDGKRKPIVGRINAFGNSVLENAARLKAVGPMSEQARLERAKKVDLVTLPPNIAGTNCGNCRYSTKAPGQQGLICIHPAVAQQVSVRQCCALWDARGVIRPWKK